MAEKLLNEGIEKKGGLRSAAQTNKPDIQPPPQRPAKFNANKPENNYRKSSKK